MPTSIVVSDRTREKLKLVAEPLEDTDDTVIERMVDCALRGEAYPLPPMARGIHADGAEPQVVAPSGTRPSLTHTRLLEATFDGERIPQPNWNDMAKRAHVIGRGRLASFEALLAATHANIRNGRYEGAGFVYLPDADISVQGMDSNMAWDSCVGIARAIRSTASALVLWRDKEEQRTPASR